MNKCDSCNIIIVDDTNTCPLCNTAIKRDESPALALNPYPDIKRKTAKYAMFLRILFFFVLLLSVICIFIDYNVPAPYNWSLVVTLSLVYLFWLFYLLSRKSTGYLKNIFGAAIPGVGLIMVIDYTFGYKRWAFNYVAPGVLITINLVLIIFMIVNRKHWQSYMLSQMSTILIGLIPLYFIKVGVVTHPLLNEIAIFLCVFVFLGTVIVGGFQAKQELSRRFHI